MKKWLMRLLLLPLFVISFLTAITISLVGALLVVLVIDMHTCVIGMVCEELFMTIVNQSNESIALIEVADQGIGRNTVKNLNHGEETEMMMAVPFFILPDHRDYAVDVEWVSGRKIQDAFHYCSTLETDVDTDMIITENSIEFLETKPPQ